MPFFSARVRREDGVVTADSEYDPDYWHEKAMAIYSQVSGPGRTMAEYQAIEEPLAAIRSAQIAAAKAAFSWVDHWYETDQDEFFSTIRDRMTDEEARQIRERRTEQEYTHRAIARWAYETLRPSWRVGWTDPGQQDVGHRICDEAARRLLEDPDADPWN